MSDGHHQRRRGRALLDHVLAHGQSEAERQAALREGQRDTPRLAQTRLPADVRCVDIRWGDSLRPDGTPVLRLLVEYEIQDLLQREGTLAVTMLNPSGAGPEHGDATVTRVLNCARTFPVAGRYHQRVRILNRYPFRATDPDGLAEALRQGNADALALPAWPELLDGVEDVLLAWGKPSSRTLQRHLGTTAGDLYDALKARRARLWALQLTPDGWPRHPLMLAKNLKPRRVVWLSDGLFRWARELE